MARTCSPRLALLETFYRLIEGKLGYASRICIRDGRPLAVWVSGSSPARRIKEALGLNRRMGDVMVQSSNVSDIVRCICHCRISKSAVVSSGQGVYVSKDSGATWNETQDAGAYLSHAVGIFDQHVVEAMDNIVKHSDDGGMIWSSDSTLLPCTCVNSILMTFQWVECLCRDGFWSVQVDG